MSILTLPFFFPLTAEEKGLTGLQIGIIIGLRALVGLLVTPLIEWMTLKTSAEVTILFGNITIGIVFIALACSDLINDVTTFLVYSCISVSLLGVSGACIVIGEQCLVLRYSKKSERELTVGMFRMFGAIGILFAPVYCSVTYSIGGILVCYGILGVGFLLLAPLIFFKLRSAREHWVSVKRELDLI